MPFLGLSYSFLRAFLIFFSCVIQLVELGSVRVDIHETECTSEVKRMVTVGGGGRLKGVDFTPTDKKTVCAWAEYAIAVIA